MCGSALAFLTAALICLHNCQRGPALVLRAAWLFSLVLGLGQSENITEFEKAVHRQKISGNIDTPEGGFDAMLQAAVCESHIGWRKEAKRLLLVMTDQTSHLALDSKLAGIVVPNDGSCHLKNNVYVKSTTMDLLPLLPGAIAGEIESKAANLNNLVVEAYKKLVSEVKVQVENQVHGVNFNITAICPDGARKPGAIGCGNVTSNDEVLFNVTVVMKTCDVTGGKNYAIIKPIGFNETTKVHIHRSCNCQCEDRRGRKGQCPEAALDPKCPQCDDSKCHFDEDQFPSETCKLQEDQPVCSGRGVCICGKCLCHKTKLGRVYGRYCEKDDFSCPYHHGNVCAGTVCSAFTLTICLRLYSISVKPPVLSWSSIMWIKHQVPVILHFPQFCETGWHGVAITVQFILAHNLLTENIQKSLKAVNHINWHCLDVHSQLNNG
ncbi:Integrin beta-8 [Cricetulus griseus]|uniref:Integrin beta n=1 Tax=Cricetulus griseus TaxID=10029 RepID=G3I6K3_CRIGR|nr:Integrin beta-8 [Cricetulus griseus]